MAKPILIIEVEGGVIQKITADTETRVIVIDRDVSELPGKDNDVVQYEDQYANVFVYPVEYAPLKVAAMIATANTGLLIKHGWIDAPEERR